MTGSRPLAELAVLLLEDSYDLADESQRTLEAAGARVLGPCREIGEIREALRADRPDCALVDINLGEGPTFEPTRVLRAESVPVILVTGYDAAIIPPDLKDIPCLQKPVDPRRLVAAVAEACGR